MPLRISITLPRRPWWRLRTPNYRRDLPASWNEVAPARRLSLLRTLYRYPGAAGRLKVLHRLLDVPRPVMLGMHDDDLVALLEATAWMEQKPSPEPILPTFVHRGVTYYAPMAHGLNLVALEYPIADESFEKFVKHGKMDDLLLLVATLYREGHTDPAEVQRRGDPRAPLLSRWQAEHRATLLAGLSEEVRAAALLYFAGVKAYVHKAYGQHLFEQEEEESAGESNTAQNLGWWGVYFNLAQDGPFGRNVEEVYQTAFHDVCLFLVDRKRQADRRATQERMQNPDFGNPNPL